MHIPIFVVLLNLSFLFYAFKMYGSSLNMNSIVLLYVYVFLVKKECQGQAKRHDPMETNIQIFNTIYCLAISVNLIYDRYEMHVGPTNLLARA